MNWFVAVMLVVGAVMFGMPLMLAAMDAEWSWYYLPIIIVGLVLLIGGMAEGTS